MPLFCFVQFSYRFCHSERLSEESTGLQATPILKSPIDAATCLPSGCFARLSMTFAQGTFLSVEQRQNMRLRFCNATRSIYMKKDVPKGEAKKNDLISY